MQRIKNLTNSPYDIRVKGGKTERLPARGEITVDVDPLHLPLYRTIGYFQLSETASVPPAEPVGNWQNGKPVAAKKADATKEVDPELAKLRKDYTELTGKKFFHKWDAAELQKRIDAALAG
ncbi:hypothetical protein [Brucella pseudogrignonensis]|uniref:hypothetical protein n=1 Tax=Brucella pseudogrignonensis TaxID=419475 RepID=UPI003ECE8FE7